MALRIGAGILDALKLRASAPSAVISVAFLVMSIVLMSANLATPAPQTGSPPTSTHTHPYPTPTSFTWEAASAFQNLDPTIEYNSQDQAAVQNIYEPLLWYSGGSTNAQTPWLAQSLPTVSPDFKVYAFTLRSGISFADGEPFNSSAVFFSLNRVLINDGNQPGCHGCGSGWILEQFEDHGLSQFYCGSCANYTAKWVSAVLNENLVQITGPATLTLNVKNPQASFPSVLATDFVGAILAPSYTMQKDLAYWASQAYYLPYPTLTGTEMQMMVEYFNDEAALCNTAVNSNGCGQTYLDTSSSGSLAGTGPYTLQSFDPSTSLVVLSANHNYWGGPYGNISASIPTINMKYVQSDLQRLADLSAAGSAIATSRMGFMADVPNNQLYAVANAEAWQTTKTLSSVVGGVNLYGPYTELATLFAPFNTNVTNPTTGQYYQFQPFADKRIRLAFADAVNVSAINKEFNDGFGQVASGDIPPGLFPAGTYDPSLTPAYSYDLSQAQSLLISAMMSPISSFTFEDGSPAPAGTFDNTFGCTTLNVNGQCDSPVPQTITLYSMPRDPLDNELLIQMAANINLISFEHNLGLTVQVVPANQPEFFARTISTPHSSAYSYGLGWIFDYPWANDFDAPMLAPAGTYTGPGGWNLAQMANLYQQEIAAGAVGNLAGVASASNAMNQLANQDVMYLWTVHPYTMFAITSNVAGVYYSPYLYGPYFAALS